MIMMLAGYLVAIVGLRYFLAGCDERENENE